ALYCKVVPNGTHLYAIYGEVDTQTDNKGGFLKVIHKGTEDAMFVALDTDGGVALEAASNKDGTRGIISTVQTQSQNPAYDNITLFTALWGQSTVPLYGMYYADQAPGNALTIRKRVAGTTATDPQIRVWDFDPDASPVIDRNRFEVLNNGTVRASSAKATSGTQTPDSPPLVLRGAYWNGSASVDRDWTVQNIVFSTTAPRTRLSFIDPGTTERVVIQDDGKVGIGTNSPDRILTLVNGGGNARADGWDTYSSRRWKKNIRTITGALGKIMRLRGVSYDRQADGKHQIGVVAEEVAAVAPEVVGFDEKGQEASSVEYGRLVALLIEAIKEQQAEIEELKNVALIRNGNG
ncbi:MAG: tail fiber domain-containing protein, partial [Acidobacteria bacterium]|nr:tail fiber domain-containing protein [Acidobacteriota bacterium]